MVLTKEEARAVVWNESEDWEPASKETLEDTTRWSIQKSGVFLHKPTCNFYEFYWQIGATERQDESPFEYEEEVEPVEVRLIEKTIEVWEPIE